MNTSLLEHLFSVIWGKGLGLALLEWTVTYVLLPEEVFSTAAAPLYFLPTGEQDSSSCGQNMSPGAQNSRLRLLPVAPEAALGWRQDMGRYVSDHTGVSII